MSELLLCPFCVGEAVLHQTYDMDTGAVDGWFAWCDNDTCECKPETGQFFTEAEAIAAWNSRADYHGYEQAAIEAWQNVKAYKERTCHDINIDLANAFECSMCGFMASTSFGQFEYCPGCGAKVVGE